MTHADFPEFFSAIHDNTPFPWQSRLAEHVAREKRWPELLDLPTGSGKTAAIDVVVFTLALDADRPEGQPRYAPLRTFFVVDRRIVVDEAAQRARKIAGKLRKALGDPKSKPILWEVASRLVRISGLDLDRDQRDDIWPLRVSALRGGMYRDDTWADSPAQPLICSSTIDQIGSRLLFRGYGLGRSGRVAHAGLVGNDSLILLDEAHLSKPFLDTVQSIDAFRQRDRPAWGARMPELPFQVVPMSATSGSHSPPFKLEKADHDDKILRLRLTSSKIASLDEVPTTKDEDDQNQQKLAKRLAECAVSLSQNTVKSESGEYPPRIVGIVVNRVDTARRVHKILNDREEKDGEVVLLTGRIRPIDRDRLLAQYLKRMKAGRDRNLETRKLYVVATQTIECGADVDLDALVTEAAPLDSLRQRFGRLDRLGELRLTHAVIVARKDSVATNAEDPIYGDAVAGTWKWLVDQASGSKKRERRIDFGINAMDARLVGDPEAIQKLCSPKSQAPVLLPAHIDNWVQTEPIPVPDPDVSLFLHGPQRSADVQVVWRADLPFDELTSLTDVPNQNRELPAKFQKRIEALARECTKIVSLARPSSLEALSVPIYAARAWLSRSEGTAIGDLEGQPDPVADDRPAVRPWFSLRWRGLDDSELIQPADLRPGDTIIVPSRYGGADKFGWNPVITQAVKDVGDLAALKAHGKPLLRIHPDVVEDWQPDAQSDDGEKLKDQIRKLLNPPSLDEEDDSGSGPNIEVILATINSFPGVPPWVTRVCNELTRDRQRKTADYEIKGPERPFALRGSKRLPPEALRQIDEGLHADEDEEPENDVDSDGLSDDDSTSFRDVTAVTLSAHCRGVAKLAEQFGDAIGLPKHIVSCLELAGLFHDLGKLDPRFQAWLFGGDEIAAKLAAQPLAKSLAERQDRASIARARERARYPTGSRHEALSVALVRSIPNIQAEARGGDPTLVYFLMGTHHGRGRPFWPVVNDTENPTIAYRLDGKRPFWRVVDDQESPNRRDPLGEIALSSPARHGLERVDSGWTDQFWRMVRDYGPWGLALLEAILILADHNRSRSEQEGSS
jgi:CRISPR-associated endonuclease/helicase Cas3